jgi:hypothetical protein
LIGCGALLIAHVAVIDDRKEQCFAPRPAPQGAGRPQGNGGGQFRMIMRILDRCSDRQRNIEVERDRGTAIDQSGLGGSESVTSTMAQYRSHR